jgi:Flp pilus assembly pilin Flp
MLRQLLRDENGFIVSAELVMVATLCVIGLVVGLAEVQHAVVQELNDVAEAIGALNQSYFYTGFLSLKEDGSPKAGFNGSAFLDTVDACDRNQCDLDCAAPAPEGDKIN